MTMHSVETSSEDQPDLSNTTAIQKTCQSIYSDNVTVKPDIITSTKRVSFHFKPNRDDALSLNTIQNIYDPNSNYNESRINNKTAYLKLHRHTFSPGSNFVVQRLKGKYENSTDLETGKLNSNNGELKQADHLQNTSSNKLTSDTIDKLRQKYSPKSFGYPKTKVLLPSKIPIPTPRNSLKKPKVEAVTVKTVTVDEKENLKVPIITEVTPSNFEEVQLIYDHIEFAKPEDKHFVVTRSSSEDSVLKVENSLAEFVMEKKPKEKKRSSSFRRILSGGLFGRDKKKPDEDKSKPKKKDNAVFADNAQNESQVFDRCAHRHTVDSSYPRRCIQKTNSQQNHNNSGPLYYYKPQQHHLNTTGTRGRNMDSRYTDMKGNSMVPLGKSKQVHEDYVPMDNSSKVNYLNVGKFIDTGSSSSNTDSDSRNCTYQNALIAQAELRHIRENENRKNTLQRSNPQGLNSDSSSSLETPPRNQKVVTNVELVKPKALIPISSERPLPNPYHNVRDNLDSYENVASKTIERNLDIDSSKPIPNKNHFYDERVKSPNNTIVVEDVYGTVFDSIISVNDLKCDTKSNSSGSVSQISPKSLEASKLKLPSNREKVELQPRIRSPIPQAKVSTDKIIATELLRNRGSPSRSPMGSIERQCFSRNNYENQERLLNAHSTPRSPIGSIERQRLSTNTHENQERLPNAHSTPRSPIGSIERQRLSRNAHENQERLPNAHSTPRSPIGTIERQRLSRNNHENEERLLNAHLTPRVSSNEYIHLNTATSYAAAKPPPSPRAELHRRQKESQHVTLATVHSDATDRYEGSPLSPHYTQERATFVPTYVKRDVTYYSHAGAPSPMPSSTVHKPTTGNSSRTADDLYETRITYPERRSPLYNVRQTNALPTCFTTTEESPYSRNSLRVKAPLAPNNLQHDLRYHQNHQTQHQRDSIVSDTSYATLQQIESAPNSIRAHTPVNQTIIVPQQRSPEKQHMIQNVEAFYWRELKKLKDKEEQDLLNYRQQQFYVYGYAEDPVAVRRSRSVSPTMQRGRRSLSLPREGQQPPPRIAHETIVEGRPLIDKRPITLPNDIEYGQIRQHFQRNPNFVRNTFERTTIGPIGRSRYYEQPKQQNYPPIFKRGSLTSDSNVCNETQINKKVSFSNSGHPHNVTSWPTKNGFTQSPPTRRIARDVSIEDDVFLPNSPRSPQSRRMENIYMNDSDPTLFKTSPQSTKIILPNRSVEPMYESAFTKQVTVSNKVCDMYGQIHDPQKSYAGQTIQLPQQTYGQIRQVGYVYGQLQQYPNQQSPVVMRQTFDYVNPAQSNFVRGTRLTASVNDMYHRYPVDSTNRVEFVRNTTQAPNRPLPPVPERTDSRSVLSRKFIRVYPQYSDTESGSEAAEVQRILRMGAKQKSFGAIGK